MNTAATTVREPQRPPGGFQQQHQAAQGNDQILGDGRTRALRELVIEQEQIGR